MAYDPKKTAKSALKVALYAAGGVLTADALGLTVWLQSFLPTSVAPIGGVIISSLLAAYRNWYVNQAKG